MKRTVRLNLWLLVVVFSLFVFSSSAFSQVQSDGLAKVLDDLARDVSQSCQNLESGDLSSDAVFSKLEDVSAGEVKSFIESVNSPEQIKYVVETVRAFSGENKKMPYVLASIKTLKLLDEKTRFLAAQNPGSGEYAEIAGRIKSLSSSLNADRSALARAGAATKAAPDAGIVKKAGAAKAPASSGGEKLRFGANYYASSGTTTFALNAPRATAVKLALFDSAEAKAGKEFEMKKTAEGVWYLAFKQNLVGKFYGYKLDGPTGPGEYFNPEDLVSDPYAYANVGSGGKSVVVDTGFNWTDGDFTTPKIADAVVYEMHIKDYTAHASSGVEADKKGKYLGLLEGASSDRVLGNIKDLGVNAVELLPVHEFDNKAAPSGVNHWGYMTTHFMAPESSYATDDCGKQVVEFKKLVNGLHKAGVAVILDVVYNHTAEGNEKGPKLSFRGIDNAAYYRLCQDKRYYWNGTGCGNEFRSDSEMGRRYILDTLMYWVKEYHVDGFRFDLATILDKDTMMAINNTLPKNVILIAEPWAADWNRNQWSKGDLRGTKWAKWNDDFKNNVKNFITGKGNKDNLMTVICGTTFWWASKPTESVNFVECHDNATIMDYCGNNQKIAKLGGLIVLTSQGVPMLHEGQEFLKNKFGNDNSYDQDNDVNYINWKLKEKNKEAFDYFAGLVAIRKAFPHFRKDSSLTDKDVRWLLSQDNAVGYQLFGRDCDVVVLLNGDQNNWVKFGLPDDKEWTVLCDGEKASVSGLRTAKGDYNVPAITGVILMRKK